MPQDQAKSGEEALLTGAFAVAVLAVASEEGRRLVATRA